MRSIYSSVVDFEINSEVHGLVRESRVHVLESLDCSMVLRASLAIRVVSMIYGCRE